jgi:hypothetical protein
MRVCGHAGKLARVRTPSSPVRVREREREREIERERGRERERCRIWLLNFKEMTGALAPFRFLVD